MTGKPRIAIAQLNPTVGDIAGNTARVRDALGKCPADTELLVFPELFLTGYPAEDLILKPSFVDAAEKAVRDLAATIDKIAVLVGAPARIDGHVYNAVHLLHEGRIIATRTKHHLPNYGVFDEVRVFTPGPLPEPIMFRNCNLGLMICEDVWFPDVAAHLKSRGADILVIPNASPFEIGKREKRVQTIARRVQETGLPVIYVNQTGGQDELVFDGGSFVMMADGNIPVRAPEFSESILSASTPAQAILPDGPGLIYHAVTLGLRDYVRKNGFPGVLIGMSGGIDSAISAAIAVDALGPASVRAVMMPSIYTSRESIDDAADCCGALNIRLDNVPIINPVESFEEVLSPHLTTDVPAITHENLQSRARGVILMALSNATGAMVLSTGNKSEMATGYATLYGDMCGGFNALKDVYKTDIFAMARWRNAYVPDGGLGPAGTVIPENIITKPPTAELKPNQRDQDTLPPYDLLDTILRGLIEDEHDAAAIAAAHGCDPTLIARVRVMLDRAEYKRRQAPPGVKITPRAFGRERRYPITNHFSA